MRIEPYICIGSVELANDLRTLTYLRRGLGGTSWDIGTRSPLLPDAHCHDEVVSDVYVDTYNDTYSGSIGTICDQDGYTPQNLAAYCAAYDFSLDQASKNYLSPADDPAPWYVASRPGSGDFLGLVLGDTTTHPTLARSLDHGDRGASVGPARAGGQIIAVNGLMLAASACGMEFGERWLFDVLAALCGGDLDLRLLPCCGEPPLWRTLPRVGLIDTPVFGAMGDAPECLVQSVAFQLGSESPWLVSDADVLADDIALASGAVLRYLVETEAWPGDAGLRFVIDAGQAGITNLRVSAVPSADGSCPPSAPRGTCWAWETNLPAGHRLIIDGNDRIAQVLNPATGAVLGGLDLLGYAPPFIFPEIGPCSKACVTVSVATAGSGSRLTLQRFDREL